MNRQEKDYLVRKLREIAETTKAKYASAHPQFFTGKDILVRLRELGYITPDPEDVARSYYTRSEGYSGIIWPATDEMKANKRLIEHMNKSIDAALSYAIDAVYLGSADALESLTSFRTAMEELVH